MIEYWLAIGHLADADVGQDPGHPQLVVGVVDDHGHGGGAPYHQDDQQEEVGVHHRALQTRGRKLFKL